MHGVMQSLILILLSGALVGADTINVEDCATLGFTGEASCSDCDAMLEYVKDEELRSECKRCCVMDEQSVRFGEARLEVCPYKLSGLPAIQDFIHKHSKQFSKKKLSIVKRMGAYPKLVLLSKEAGGSKQSVRIDNWSARKLVDFLKEKLEQPASA